MCAIETMTALPFVKFFIDQECQKNPCDPNQFISKPPTLSTCACCVPTMIDRISMTSPPASSSACEGECPFPSLSIHIYTEINTNTTNLLLPNKQPNLPKPIHPNLQTFSTIQTTQNVFFRPTTTTTLPHRRPRPIRQRRRRGTSSPSPPLEPSLSRANNRLYSPQSAQ